MEHQYTQTGSLVGLCLGASLSKAKTDTLGNRNVKVERLTPQTSFCSLSFSLSHYLTRLEKLTKLEADLSTRKCFPFLLDK